MRLPLAVGVCMVTSMTTTTTTTWLLHPGVGLIPLHDPTPAPFMGAITRASQTNSKGSPLFSVLSVCNRSKERGNLNLSCLLFYFFFFSIATEIL